MRALVVSAHPVETSFAAAIRATIVETLRGRGCEVDDCDLYAENFPAVLTRAERLAYHDVPQNVGPVAEHVERLRRAEAFVLVHPVWNYGMPAIMKGYFDRVFLPGVSFALTETGVAPCMTHIRKALVVTTYGGGRLRTMLVGDPPRRVAKRFLRGVFQTRVDYLALYDMNNFTPARGRAFLDRVKSAAAAL